MVKIAAQQPLRIVIVEDLQTDAELMVREVKRAGFEPLTWQRVDTAGAFLSAVSSPPDVILSDFNVPGFGAEVALELLRTRDLDIPFIVVSGSIGEETAVRILRAGAADYLLKDRMARLGPAVRRVMDERQLQRERRELEDLYRQAQKMEAIGQLAGGVAHDFNNLLTVIQGYCELLAEALPEEGPHHSYIGELRRATHSAAALTRQLLAFGRRQLLEPRVLDLGDAVRSIEPMLKRLIGEHIEVIVTVAPGSHRVRADPGQIEQIIINLAVNARDAMPGGGQLRLDVAGVHTDNAHARMHGISTDSVTLHVSDDGIGMDAATQARVFEPFFTTKQKGRGTGLGLATVYGIVKQSGGDITLRSELGQGSTFSIYLPRVDEPISQPLAAATRDAPRGSETILLVEDEELVRDLVRQILERFGYRVLVANTPREAMRVSATEPGEIHLLLTDVVLPEMSGSALAQLITSERPDIRVLFVSGYTDTAFGDGRMLEEGTPFLQKPFTPATLAGKVREALARR